MIGKNCKGLNLLNHCNQLKKPENLKIEYNEKEIRREKLWECILSYNSNGKLVKHSNIEVQKTLSLKRLLIKIEEDLKKEL